MSETMALALAAGFCLSLAGLLLLASSLSRHQSDVFRRRFPIGRSRTLRAGGWALLAASFALTLALRGGSGSVDWLGGLTAAALLVSLLLTYRPRHLPWLTGTSLTGGALLGALVWLHA